jgi:hypothetical protein
VTREEESRFDALFARVVAQLEVTSNAASALGFTRPSAVEQLANRPDPRRAPTGDADPPHEFFKRRYAGCRTDKQRRSVIEDALAELRAIHYARRPKVDRNTLEGRLEIGRDPRPAGVVAYVYGFSERHIHRLRAQARSHDSRTGQRNAVP